MSASETIPRPQATASDFPLFYFGFTIGVLLAECLPPEVLEVVIESLTNTLKIAEDANA